MCFTQSAIVEDLQKNINFVENYKIINTDLIEKYLISLQFWVFSCLTNYIENDETS